ncbi:hypothetical protein Tsubulata_020095 [Turnera subulata]|uniref:SUI1 domain-containing protein n=1 Tax=Turnera subulata TaxID=218843 RepID=A0A9Q0GIC1_9ROSI|nr:hypothetical protein Tsubulata_020095 [Turnera subulata]
MVDFEFQIPAAFDPFAEEDEFFDDDATGSSKKASHYLGTGSSKKAIHYVHIRKQQRNGKKSITTVEGLPKEVNFARILKDLKRSLNCNGTIVQDTELGQILQLQGDQRVKVQQFLVTADIAQKENIKVHGF